MKGRKSEGLEQKNMGTHWTDNLTTLDPADFKEIDAEGLCELDGFEVHNPEASATLNANVGIPEDRRLIRRPLNRKLLDSQQVATMAETLRPLPADGETYHIVLSGKASLWDTVPAVLELATPATIAELWIATLGFSARNTEELMAFLDGGQVQRCHFICSHYFRGTSEHLYTPMEQGLTARGQRFLAMRNHTKVILMTLTDGRCIVGESSANLRSCKNIETLTLTHDRALLEFHARWMNDIFEEAHHAHAP